ncbi:MAG: dienelactone hydrolase family protein [Bryobacteraceae bacterium]
MTAALLLILLTGVSQDTLQVSSGLQGMTDRYLDRVEQECRDRRAVEMSRVRSAAAVRARQAYIQRKLLEQIGGFPARTPLNPRLSGTLRRPGYRVEKLIFESQPRFYVTANVYVPEGPPPPFAAVLGSGDQGKASGQRAWIGLVKRGFLVLAYDLPGQGERAGDAAAAQCLLTGTNEARWQIWDGIRAVDYLLTRPDVDPRRIAVTGGAQAAYLAALEPRLAAAATSAYLTPPLAGFWRDGLDISDLPIAFAPRPMLMAGAAYQEARPIYAVLRAKERAGVFDDDPHGRRWFSKWLLGTDAREPAIETIPEAELRATAAGLPGAETVQSLNAALAGQLHAARKKTGDLRALLGIDGPRGLPPWGGQGEVEGRGCRIEKIEMQPEPGIIVPMLLFLPAGGAPRKSAVLWLDPAGKSADLAAIEALVRADNVVLAADLRNWGESAPAEYATPHQAAQRALLAGKTLIGMQVYDALRAFDWLAARHEVDSRRITVSGKGSGGVAALFARALEPRIAAVKTEGAPRCYLALARGPAPPDLIEIAVPGILRHFDLPDFTTPGGAR